MTINLLYGCCQIETSTRDLSETRAFMIDVLGAGPTEQVLARQIAQIIPDEGYDVDHIECGEAVFQINQPSPTMTYNGRPSVHQAYLDSVGPTVTNLNFFVDDIEHARGLLTSVGAATHIEGPSSAAQALADYGRDNTRPGADERPFLFMGARHLLGFDLEIMEPNFLRFSEQTAQYPAYSKPRPKTGDGNLYLERLIVAVESLEQTEANIERLFSPACRSRPYRLSEGPDGIAFHVTLGGIEIQYCAPCSTSGAIAEHLEQVGQGILAIEFSAIDPAAVIARCRDIKLGFEEDADFVGAEPLSRNYVIRCRPITGFDVLLLAATQRRTQQ